MVFEFVAHRHQLFVRRGHLPGQIGNRMRRAHACHHVFALGVDQIFPIENFFAAGRIARESDSGRAGVAHVAEHHCLDVDRRSPIVRETIFAAINNGAVVHP